MAPSARVGLRAEIPTIGTVGGVQGRPGRWAGVVGGGGADGKYQPLGTAGRRGYGRPFGTTVRTGGAAACVWSLASPAKWVATRGFMK